MIKLTVIIPCRNDPLLPRTVASILQDKGKAINIIVVDDASEVPIPESPDYHLIRNEWRLGPGPSRHKGAKLVEDGWLLFADSHLTFPSNWYDEACSYLRESDTVVWGATYETDEIFDSFWHDTHLIGGADFYLFRYRGDEFSFCDVLPRRVENRREWIVPCVLGGCYFVEKRWFDQIGGFSPLVGYGSEETWLSMATWLAGGSVSIMGRLIVTHHYQKCPKASLYPGESERNRLVVLRLILGEELYENLLMFLPIQEPAMSLAKETLLPPRKLAGLSYDHIMQGFNLQTFEEALDLATGFHLSAMTRCRVCRNRRWLILRDALMMAPCAICNPGGKTRPNFCNFAILPTPL